MLFKKKPKKEKPAAIYEYTQAENYKGFKRYKLSSYGHQAALDGIQALSDADLTGANINISVYDGEYPRAVVTVNNHEIGTIWKDSFDKFNAIKTGKLAAVRVEIRDRDSYLFNVSISIKKPLKSKINGPFFGPKTQKNRDHNSPGFLLRISVERR